MPRRKAPCGVEIWRGRSRLDGAPIVALASFNSTNPKTGPGPQAWILRADVPPVVAVKTGADASVCGACSLRPSLGGGCYVQTFHAPRAVWDAWQRGRYRRLDPADVAGRFAGQHVRIGAYGDPAAVPIDVWESVVSRASSWTGYTHQWRDGFALQHLCMASVETDADAADAIAMGYRVFRMTRPGAPRLPGHFVCPASAERGHVLQCHACQGCDGTASRRGHVQIAAHGSRYKMALAVLD